MSRGRCKHILSFVALALAIILFAGFTGISVHVHYCHGDRSAVHFFPELISKTDSCKCETDADDQCHTANKGSHSLKHKPCCTDLYYFKKLYVDSNIQFSSLSFKDFFTLPVKMVPVAAQHLPELTETINRPPPVGHSISGRNRVVLLHQIRFSAVSGDC